jgi:hypothetical protein
MLMRNRITLNRSEISVFLGLSIWNCLVAAFFLKYNVVFFASLEQEFVYYVDEVF